MIGADLPKMGGLTAFVVVDAFDRFNVMSTYSPSKTAKTPDAVPQAGPTASAAAATARVVLGELPMPAVAATVATDAISCMRAALQASDWTSSGAAVVSELAHQLNALRVSLGWFVGGQLRIVALSDGVVLEEGAAIPELSQAMLEAAHQQACISWPPPQPPNHLISLAHQALFKAQGLAGVVSMPLACQGQVVGVLTCERSAPLEALRTGVVTPRVRAAFEPAEVQWLASVAESMAPLWRLQYRLERPISERIRDDVRLFRQRLGDPRERRLRWMMAALALTLAYGAFWPMPHRVTAQARLEGAVQRVLSAPQDGFLREVQVRPGDVVTQGQVLASLSDDELQNERRARMAALSQQDNAFAEAFARGDRAQAAMAQSKATEIKAQLALIEQQIERTQLLAPFDGVVIAGDLHQQLGAPVKRGDALITLAPGLDWRVMMEVSEADVAELRRGQTAILRLAAMPDQPIGLAVERITPVARSTADGVRYEVEARPTGLGAGLAGLRPGLEGVAKVELPDQPILWRWGVKAWQWLRMLAWDWL